MNMTVDHLFSLIIISLRLRSLYQRCDSFETESETVTHIRFIVSVLKDRNVTLLEAQIQKYYNFSHLIYYWNVYEVKDEGKLALVHCHNICVTNFSSLQNVCTQRSEFLYSYTHALHCTCNLCLRPRCRPENKKLVKTKTVSVWIKVNSS